MRKSFCGRWSESVGSSCISVEDARSSDKAVEAPAALEALLRRAEAAGASDVHLQQVGKGAQVCFRLDGMLTPSWTLEGALVERLFGRIKYLARLKTYQDSLPQDGRIDRSEVGTSSEVRVATYPTVTGEKIVLRLFRESEVAGLEALGLPVEAREQVESFLRGTTGLMLLTGPAGSGKTTTIYACLRHVAAAGGRHIITVEDPVERVVAGVMQTEVNEAQGLRSATVEVRWARVAIQRPAVGGQKAGRRCSCGRCGCTNRSRRPGSKRWTGCS